MRAEANGPETVLEKFRIPLLLATAILGLDQGTKLAIRRSMSLGDQVTVFEGLLNIVHARNPGAAFSFLATAPDWFREPFFIVVTVIAILTILIVMARSTPEEGVTRLALGGILGGAVGNLLDRLMHGEVIDFVDVYWHTHHWPAFNVADSAISLSVAAILAHTLLTGREQSAGETRSDASQP